MITGLIGIVATGFFAIPIGVLSGAFEDDFGLGDDDDDDDDDGGGGDDDDDDDDEGDAIELTAGGCFGCGPAHEQAIRVNSPAWRKRLNGFVEAETTHGVIFEIMIFFFIFATIFTSILSTVEGIRENTGLTEARNIFEAIAVIIFTVEYLLRLLAAPDSPALRGIDSATMARLWHTISFCTFLKHYTVYPRGCTFRAFCWSVECLKCSDMSTCLVWLQTL